MPNSSKYNLELTLLLMFINWVILHAHPPYWNTVHSVLSLPPSLLEIKTGYFFRISSPSSQVSSFGIKCFHYTLSQVTTWFQSIVSFMSRMHRGSTWNYPYGSTCTTFQSTVWVESCINFFSNEIWKTLWILKCVERASLYATGPILSKIWKGL